MVRRTLDDVMSGLQPTWPDVYAERVVDADGRRIHHAVNARNACELYTQRLTDVIGSKVKRRRFVFRPRLTYNHRRRNLSPWDGSGWLK